MKLLLDTHVWLWWNTESDRLAPAAVRQIENPRHEVFLSAASVWRWPSKRRLGRLPLPEPVAAYVARRLKSDADPRFGLALARLLAAAPAPQVRDGRRALAIVDELLAGERTVELGETTAIALAEVGDFGQAAAVQRQVM